MTKSWRKSAKDYSEYAMHALRMLVIARRQTGMLLTAALECDAPTLGITMRRARRLYECDRDPIVNLDECQKIVGGVIQCRRDIAAWMRRRADEMDLETDKLELQQRDLRGDAWTTNGADSAQTRAGQSRTCLTTAQPA